MNFRPLPQINTVGNYSFRDYNLPKPGPIEAAPFANPVPHNMRGPYFTELVTQKIEQQGSDTVGRPIIPPNSATEQLAVLEARVSYLEGLLNQLLLRFS